MKKRIRVCVVTYGALCIQDICRRGVPADNTDSFREKD
ncbi:MAG: hypothetical protein US57_C0009G0020 [Candidatus Moranbacteria bacterium GW2011_GWC2_37_73]|nr:MAG: hypothetical protein US57_C0009G0020 [Candidatus Moranbacteria bacterium GW2011_GWC2_37_73]